LRNLFSEWRQFGEARTFTRSLCLKDVKAWRSFCKGDRKPIDIPVNPDRTYKSLGWVSWDDWLGNDNIVGFKRNYLPFEKARDYARGLGLITITEWKNWAKGVAKPDNIPAAPWTVYANEGYTNIGDWLGTGRTANQKRTYLPFEEARKFVCKLELKSNDDWWKWVKSGKKPDNIPADPRKVYRDQGWKNLGDWLGTGNIAPQKRTFLPFEKARGHVRKLELKNQAAWLKWAKSNARPENIPYEPHEVYKDQGWEDLDDWLNSGRTANKNKKFLPFEKAREYVRKLGLESQDEWQEWAKSDARPDSIPAGPDQIYNNLGWAGWMDWLGKPNKWNRNAILCFLRDIKPVLSYLKPVELYAIMRQNNMIASMGYSNQSNAYLGYYFKAGHLAEKAFEP